MKFITVDIGSTYIKAGLLDVEQRRSVEQKKYGTPKRRPNPDGAYYENDAAEFVEIIKGLIRDFGTRYPDTEGILFSTQQHGCVISHPALSEDTYISWQDTRCLKERAGTGKSYMQELRELFSREDMAANGVYIKPALALCNLYTLFAESELSKDSAVTVDTLGSYIIGKLTGRRICHITNAAPMGFADVRACAWRWDMLQRVGLDFISLPAITEELECCGFYEEDGLRIAVFPDMGDVQTSVYGTDAADGDLVINIGTSGQLIYITNQFVPGNYEIRPFYENNFCNVISCMPGGRNFDVQIEYIQDIGQRIFGISLTKGEIWERIEQMEECCDTQGLEVDCGFYELPDRLADGSIRHVNHANLKLSNVIQATAVDFGRQYKRFADYLCGGEVRQGRIYFTGGAVLKNRNLQEAIRQELGVEQILCASDDEVFRGMQKLALRCAERIGSDETGNQRRERSNGGLPFGNCCPQPAAADAGIGA